MTQFPAVFVTKNGKPDVLKVRETTLAELQQDEIEIRVHAAGVNFADIMMRQGLYPEAPQLPFVPGYEVSGVVENIGSGVTEFQPGDRVLAITRFGGYAQRAKVRNGYARKIDHQTSFVEAAAIPVNYLTAWVGLFSMAKIKKGQSVFIHHVLGGVGLAATQLAKAVGARVIGSTGSDEKIAQASAFGIDHLFNYHDKNFVKEARRFTEGDGVDIVLDATGINLKKDFQALKPAGCIILFGVSDMVRPGKRRILHAAVDLIRLFNLNPIWLLSQNRGIYGLNLLKLYGNLDLVAEGIQTIEKHQSAGKIRPVIAKTFDFQQAADAHAYLENRYNVGKVILTFPKKD